MNSLTPVLLTKEQILWLLDRLKWDSVYENERIVVCEKRGIGYSSDHQVGAIEVALSLSLQSARATKGGAT